MTGRPVGRHKAWEVRAAFLGGAIVGGCQLGVGLAAVSLLLGWLPPLRLGLVAALLAMSMGASLSSKVWSLSPQRRRQVAYATLSRRAGRLIGPFIWGKDLGLAVKTNLVTPAIYVVAAMALLISPSGALLLGMSYGITRGSTIVVASFILERRLTRSADGTEPLLGIRRAIGLPTTAALVVALITLLHTRWNAL